MATSFTYTDTLATARDKVRFLIGDTVVAYRLFWNEEIDALLARFDNDTYKAAGWALRVLAQDPDRLVALKDATAGGFTLLECMRLCAERADRWLG